MPAVENEPENEPEHEAEAQPEHDDHPLERIRKAQARRVPPPGTFQGSGRGGGRGANPKAPRHYNRHK
jgi:hypothetical protein